MRVILITLDSLGIGELPDAGSYGDSGANTLLNIQKYAPQMRLVNMNKLGLSHIDGNIGVKTMEPCSVSTMELCSVSANDEPPVGSYAKMSETSAGKDTTTGHWEIAGLITKTPFPTFPNGFPTELITEFEQKIGRKILGNCVASGTEIINRLGMEHEKTGFPIVYTSADSVFQIAAHESVISVEELYKMCETARKMLTGEWSVSRVIARPFIGSCNNYSRTSNRHDFSLKPFGKTMLDYISESGMTVYAIGKISDIFCGCGITTSVHITGNSDGIDKTADALAIVENGLIFTNLVDFDMLYGHRRDCSGYAEALSFFDSRLPELTAKMRDNDILILTADHGCDPTFKGTDHTREYVPLLVYGKNVKANINLGTRSSFADIAKTITDYLGVDAKIAGKSFLSEIIKQL